MDINFICCSELLDAGIPEACLTSLGGCRNVYVTDACNVISVTETDGLITAIQMASGTQFYKFAFARDGATYTEDGVFSPQNGTYFYDQTVTFTVPKRELSKRQVLRLLVVKKLLFIVEDANGNFNLGGRYFGAEQTAHTSTTGAARADANNYVITINSQEPEQAPFIDPAIVPALI